MQIEETLEDQHVRRSTAGLPDLYAKIVRTGFSARRYHVSPLVYYNNSTYALLRLSRRALKEDIHLPGRAKMNNGFPRLHPPPPAFWKPERR